MNNKCLIVAIFVILYVPTNFAVKRHRQVNTGRGKSTRRSVSIPDKDHIELKPGKPVPRSQQIHRMLTKYLFQRPDTIDGSSIVNFLKGGNPVLDKRLANISVLDTKTIKKMVKLAKEKDKKAIAADPSKFDERRYVHDLLVMTGKDLIDYKPEELKESERNFKKKIADTRRWFDGENLQILFDTNDREWKEYVRMLMLQSVYQTRFNLLRTKEYRLRYKFNHSFQIAILYGSVVETVKKLRELYTTCTRFHRYIYNHKLQPFFRVKFLWYLIVYEKALAAHTDLTFYVKEIFVIHKYFEARVMHFILTDPEMSQQGAPPPPAG